MTDQRIDQLLADLDSALAVEPSPLVVTKARLRSAEAPVPRLGWRWLPLAVGAAAITTAIYTYWPREAVGPVPSASGAEVLPSAAPEAARAGREFRPSRSVEQVVRRSAARITLEDAPSAPVEALVPGDQMAGVLHLLVRRSSTLANSVPASNPFQPFDDLTPPEPLRIATLEITPLGSTRDDAESRQ